MTYKNVKTRLLMQTKNFKKKLNGRINISYSFIFNIINYKNKSAQLNKIYIKLRVTSSRFESLSLLNLKEKKGTHDLFYYFYFFIHEIVNDMKIILYLSP